MKILNFGSCNVDYVYSMERIVAPGETLSASKMELFPGGKGLNQSVAVAKAGAKVYHAGIIGNDGDMLFDILHKNGVDTTYINRVDAKNGHAIIQVDESGENSIFVHKGTNGMITERFVDCVIENFEKGDIILLQNEINNLEYIIDKAYQKGMRIFFNPSPFNQKLLEIPKGKVDVILDTDTYNEVDDQYAMSYLLRSGDKLNTVALYAAPFYGNGKSADPKDGMEKSYDEIIKMLKLLKKEVQVFKGSENYLSDEKTPVISDAANDLSKRAMNYTTENPLYVVAIGAITIKEAESYSKIPTWTRVIWDVTPISWLLDNDGQFTRSRLVPAPIPSYDGTYTDNPNGHLMRYVYQILRDELMNDLIQKLQQD